MKEKINASIILLNESLIITPKKFDQNGAYSWNKKLIVKLNFIR